MNSPTGPPAPSPAPGGFNPPRQNPPPGPPAPTGPTATFTPSRPPPPGPGLARPPSGGALPPPAATGGFRPPGPPAPAPPPAPQSTPSRGPPPPAPGRAGAPPSGPNPATRPPGGTGPAPGNISSSTTHEKFEPSSLSEAYRPIYDTIKRSCGVLPHIEVSATLLHPQLTFTYL